MRSLFLTVALMVASLGTVAITPDKADARPPRGWYSSYYYGDPYYSNGGPRWYGGSYWRGGTWWSPRSYSYSYSPAPYSYGTYYGPRNYYGRPFAPRYYWP
jgi:hypothetical protein